MSLINTINYNAPGSFTYDSSIVTIGSNAQLTNIRPANSTFYAGFRIPASFDGMYGNGTLTGTNNGASLGTNYLDLTGGTLKYVDYSAASNASSAQVGCVRVQVIPNYSGTPATYQLFWAITQANASSTNLIELFHSNGGDLAVVMYDQGAAPIASVNYGPWSPSAGTTYELEFNYDLTAGANRLFVNGIQQGPTNTATGTRNPATIGLLRLGSDYSLAYTANFKLTNFIVFNTVQHTSNFASEIPRAPETQYSVANPAVTVVAQTAMSLFDSFSETAVKPANTDIRYQMLVNGTAKYWNGSAWVASDGTLAQSNTAATINTNAASLLSSGANVRVAALLSSTYGTATPTLTAVEETYEFYVTPPASPSQCIVYCFLEDIIGFTNLTNAKFIVQSPNSFVINNWVVGISQVDTAFNSSGYAQVSVVSSNSVNVAYSFSITYTDEAGIDRQIIFNDAVVPTQTSINITSLTTIQAGS